MSSSSSSSPPSPSGAASRPRFDADGRERPAFLLDYPEDAELERLVAAYERGDFRTVRRQAPNLATRASNPEVRRAALELRRRIDPAPLLLWFLAGAIALFFFLVVWSYLG